jgi:hypothetical protein
MLWLSKLLPAVGSGITIPMLIIAVFLMGGKLWERRDDRLTQAGAQQCDATWRVAQANAELEAVRRQATRAIEAAEERQRIMEGLHNELEQTRQKYAGYIPSDDPRCLSDGVLDTLRRRRGVDTGR